MKLIGQRMVVDNTYAHQHQKHGRHSKHDNPKHTPQAGVCRECNKGVKAVLIKMNVKSLNCYTVPGVYFGGLHQLLQAMLIEKKEKHAHVSSTSHCA